MFCYQCEQTAKGTGCTIQGVCGKQPEVAALQDLLLYSLMGLSQVAVEGRKHGVTDGDVNVFTVQAAFSTLTNVDFDVDRAERFARNLNSNIDFFPVSCRTEEGLEKWLDWLRESVKAKKA